MMVMVIVVISRREEKGGEKGIQALIIRSGVDKKVLGDGLQRKKEEKKTGFFFPSLDGERGLARRIGEEGRGWKVDRRKGMTCCF